MARTNPILSLTLLGPLLGCGTPTPEPVADAWILVQPTLRPKGNKVSIRIQHESGAYMRIPWSAQAQLIPIRSGSYHTVSARAHGLLTGPINLNQGMRTFVIQSGRVARLDRLYVIVNTGLRVTSATGYSGKTTGTVELICDPETWELAREEFAEVLGSHETDQLCCDLKTRTFDEFLRVGHAAVLCPVDSRSE